MKKTIYIVLLPILFFLTSCIHEDVTPVKIPPFEGKVVTLNEEKGDPAEVNQFWIELVTGNVTKNHREDWDLGFYCGNEFRVILNSSLMMSAGKIENALDIDAVNSLTVSSLKPLVQVANFQDNGQYIDNPNGQILTQTSAIAEISADDSQNNVHLINMGFKTYSGTTVPGSIYSIGAERGWMKIRVLRHPLGYKIQYAGLDETTHKEFVISKDENYNHRFFSFTTGTYATVQPPKKNWDLSFTVFTNLTSAGTFMTSYVFPDFIINNTLGNVAAYEVVTAAGQGETEYNNFRLEDIDASKFITNDQRAIGSNWRTTTGPNGAEVFSNKFYILRNSEGFFFKIRFLRMKDDNGYRGYPQFEYKAL